MDILINIHRFFNNFIKEHFLRNFIDQKPRRPFLCPTKNTLIEKLVLFIFSTQLFVKKTNILSGELFIIVYLYRQ
jgi:hypothetical protein